jgi:hypothetical protein
MLTPTTKSTNDKDARRFAIYVTERMLEEGEIAGEPLDIRVAKAAFLQWSLYKLALRDNFKWDNGGPTALIMDVSPPRPLIIHCWEEKAYDRWWNRLYDEKCGRVDVGGSRDRMAGIQEQTRPRKGAKQRDAIQPDKHPTSRVSRRRNRRVVKGPRSRD